MKEKTSKKELETQKRIQNYETIRSNLLQSGYSEHTGTISALKANIMAFFTAGPFAVLILIIYFSVWKEVFFRTDFIGTILLFAVYLISIPLHEFIHGFTWHLFCKKGLKSIHFGIMWEVAMPYCNCREPLKYHSYILGGLMPFFVLGFGISVLSIILHSPFWLFIGVVNILSAGGDTTIALMLTKYRNHVILDHPTKCGFVAFYK